MLLLSALYTLGVLLPGIAVSIRLLHNTGKSGRWILVGGIPLVGLVVLVFMLMDGEQGTNRFGPNPKTSPA